MARTAKGNRGWESIAIDGNGRPLALWLDHRNSASSTPAALHQHGAGSTAKAITGGVCYCCKTFLVASGNNVYGAWRHVFPGNQRDIAFVASRDGGRTFSQIRRVSEDHWQFDGCPENGPAVTVADDGAIYVAWVTPEDGREGAPLALYYTWSRDGINFETRKRLTTDGPAADVQLIPRKDGNVAIAWDEAVPTGRRVRIATVGKALMFPNPIPGGGLYPALTRSSAGTVIAWVNRGGPKTPIGVTVLP